MINPRGALKLAITKLRTRKVRLALTVGITSLLFGVLFFAVPIAKGTFDSIERFGKEGLGKRYITQATLPAQGMVVDSEEILERADELYLDELDQKKAAAKKLGIPFDAKAESSPVSEAETPTGTIRYLNMQNPLAKKAVKEFLDQNPLIGAAELRETAKHYQPTAFYQSKQLQNGYTGAQLIPLKDGQENLTGGQSNEYGLLDSFLFRWTSIDNSLMQSFLLPNKNFDIAADGSIPLVVPFSAVESLADIDPLPNNATPEATIKHMQEVRTKAADLHFEVCYRNQASANLIANAVSTQREIERNKKNTDYQKPALIYGLPDEACGAPKVIRDVRSASEKAADTKRAQFDQMFGAEEPKQQKLRFVVVGISPDKKDGNASSISQIVGSVVNSSLGDGWYMPSSAEKQNPLLVELFTDDAYHVGVGRNYFVEFASADNARAFVNEKGCSVDSNMRSEDDGCSKASRIFTLAAFGSNTVGLESLKRQFNNAFWVALIAVAIVASLVMSNTVARMISDSRRETAIFRAMGAKRSDISGIYLTYVTLLSAMVAAVSLLAGTSLAYAASVALKPIATAQAIAIYSAQDTTMTFNLFLADWGIGALLVALIFAVGYVAATLPLLRNVRRNPIQDMRDDS